MKWRVWRECMHPVAGFEHEACCDGVGHPPLFSSSSDMYSSFEEAEAVCVLFRPNNPHHRYEPRPILLRYVVYKSSDRKYLLTKPIIFVDDPKPFLQREDCMVVDLQEQKRWDLGRWVEI